MALSSSSLRPSSLTVLPSEKTESVVPSEQPSEQTSSLPSRAVEITFSSSHLSSSLTVLPSEKTESAVPSEQPSDQPSSLPSRAVEITFSSSPLSSPLTVLPSEKTKSEVTSNQPSDEPSSVPSEAVEIKFSSSSLSSSLTVLPSEKIKPDVSSDQSSLQPSSLLSEASSISPYSRSPHLLSDQLSSQLLSDIPSSILPSDEPSLIPSMLLSDKPSMLPSDEPSLFPSDLPSILPSDQPSYLPSSLPSDQPSFMPSDQPSFIPTVSPTLSSIPSHMPSNRPSISWNPTAFPSQNPSVNPSASPSISPSLSLEPSRMPSAIPTLKPSQKPSRMPSAMPSKTPSSIPSMSPSATPSSMPSVFPSVQPSSAPTPVCHDNALYKSPLNDFLCQDHQGTQCIQWRFLGLTLEQVEELIINCPESCQVDCGSYARFEVTVSYLISGVSGWLDSTTVERMNEVGVEYLTDYVTATKPDSIFFVDNSILVSQEILPSRRSLSQKIEHTPRSRNLRRVQVGNVNLRLTIAFKGFAIEIDLQTSLQYILDGIKSPGYTKSIQNSGDPELVGATISAVVEQADRSHHFQEEAVTEGSRDVGTIAPTVVSIIFLIAVGIGGYINHRRSGKWIPGNLAGKFKSVIMGEKEIPDVHSPESQNVASAAGSYFSFDETDPGGTRSGLLRLFSSLSPSHHSTSPNSSTAKSQNTLSQDGVIVAEDVVEEEVADENEEEDELQEEVDGGQEVEDEKHPLAGVIPPMIVIDNIDDDDDNSEELIERLQLGQAVVPTKHVEASTEFIAALSRRRKPTSLCKIAGILNGNESLQTKENDTAWRQSGRSSPIGIVVDSDGEDSVSVASTPVRIQGFDFKTPVRRTKSFGDEAALVKASAELSPLRRQTFSPGYVNLNTEINIEEEAKPHNSSHISDLSSPRKDGDSMSAHSVGERETVHEDAPRRVNDGIMQQLWSLSPIAKGIKKDPTRSKKSDPLLRRSDQLMRRSESLRITPTKNDMVKVSSNPMMAKVTTTPTMAGVLAKLTATPTKGDSLAKSATTPTKKTEVVMDFGDDGADLSLPLSQDSARSSSGVLEEPSSDDSEKFFEFRAPRKGKLGLVIDSNRRTGPIVQQVKDYSPLFGCINAGDRIVEIDGQDTTRMTGDQVAKIVNTKPSRRGLGEMRIIKVARLFLKDSSHDKEVQSSLTRDRSSENSISSSLDSISSNHKLKEEARGGIGEISDPGTLLDMMHPFDFDSSETKKVVDPLFDSI